MFTSFYLSTCRIAKPVIPILLIIVFWAASCGKRQPPLPPVERIIQRAEITGVQRGNLIELILVLPAENAARDSLSNIKRIDIYRLTDLFNAELSLTEEQFASRSTLIGSVYPAQSDFLAGSIKFTDRLQFVGQNAGLRYAVRFVNGSGQKAAFSNVLNIEPTYNAAESPGSVYGEISEAAVTIRWTIPEINIDGSKAGTIIGYNVYRAEAGELSEKLLNQNPLKTNLYQDESFEFGKNYRYLVRSVSLGRTGEFVESVDSNLIEIQPRDVFAPSPPAALTIAAAPQNLSLFFAANSERDLAGYRVYRSTDRRLPLSEWSLLNKELLQSNTFQDRDVQNNTTYFYFVTAIDKIGNTSAASEIVSETAP